MHIELSAITRVYRQLFIANNCLITPYFAQLRIFLVFLSPNLCISICNRFLSIYRELASISSAYRLLSHKTVLSLCLSLFLYMRLASSLRVHSVCSVKSHKILQVFIKMCHTGKVYGKSHARGGRRGGTGCTSMRVLLALCCKVSALSCCQKEKRHEKCMENFAHYAPAESTNET